MNIVVTGSIACDYLMSARDSQITSCRNISIASASVFVDTMDKRRALRAEHRLYAGCSVSVRS
jgi:hypothetical protein